MKKMLLLFVTIILLLSGLVSGLNIQKSTKTLTNYGTENTTLEFSLNFSNPEFDLYNNSFYEYIVVKVPETNHNMIIPGKPVLPVNYQVFNLTFGTIIENIDYNISPPVKINLTGQLSFGKAVIDKIQDRLIIDKMEEFEDPYPDDWISYHSGGGILNGDHITFLVIRVFPVRYFPEDNQLRYINSIKIIISYIEPVLPIIEDKNYYDLLIISPSKFTNELQPLVCHKELYGFKTRLVSTSEIYEEMFWYGRDKVEKIKYFIKTAIENWGIEHVLLVGGIDDQSKNWNLPVRYSYVLPPTEQEYPEQKFISDLYYADVYDSQGNFCSWDSNQDDQFAVWNETYKEEMDLYPDVYLGRLPCRNKAEVKIIVNKIINYEKTKVSDEDWFKNLILVAGDSYNDINHYNEGELISEKAKTLMPGFNPVEVYARENQDINRKTVNNAMNQGAGFAYFCGHGSSGSWSTHYPPDGINWTTGYTLLDMIFLRNTNKLPITVVGGCHNGQFDVSLFRILEGIKEYGLKYFRFRQGNFGQFWYGGWEPNCWAWFLTSKIGGGAIATIANTGLGTHGDGDQDNNTIADYLEVLDGWLELRFLEKYGKDGLDNLGENHGDTLTEYLHRFLGDDAKMDVKMVQQWELFGDPSLKIGGYKNI